MAVDCSFPRSNKLVQSLDFQRIFKKADIRSADRYLCLLVSYNQKPYARLGMAIAKKKIRKATARNRIKRLVRESFRTHKTSIPGVDIVVLAQPPAAAIDNAQLLASLARHWEKISSQCKKSHY